MVGIIYADPDKAIKAAFQFIVTLSVKSAIHTGSFISAIMYLKHLGNEK